MPAKRRAALAVLVLAIALVSGCGSSDNSPEGARTTTTPLAQEDRLVERRLVLGRDVAKAPANSPQRAFLEFWSALSYEDWTTAIDYVDVKIRRALQAGYLVDALRIEGQNNVPIKPLIRSIRRTRAGTSIRYYVRTGDGRLRPTSSTWRQRNGVWYLAYSSMLDESYGAAVQAAVQNDVNPKATAVSKRAISAGRRATREQARVLDPQE